MSSTTIFFKKYTYHRGILLSPYSYFSIELAVISVKSLVMRAARAGIVRPSFARSLFAVSGGIFLVGRIETGGGGGKRERREREREKKNHFALSREVI